MRDLKLEPKLQDMGDIPSDDDALAIDYTPSPPNDSTVEALTYSITGCIYILMNMF